MKQVLKYFKENFLSLKVQQVVGQFRKTEKSQQLVVLLMNKIINATSCGRISFSEVGEISPQVVDRFQDNLKKLRLELSC
jgi:hypothetical protein